VDGQERRFHPDEHHNPSIEDSFWDKHGNVIKPVVVADYNRHLDDVDKDRMAVAIQSAIERGSRQRSSYSTC